MQIVVYFFLPIDLPQVPPPEAVADRLQWILDTGRTNHTMLCRMWEAMTKIRPCACLSGSSVRRDGSESQQERAADAAGFSEPYLSAHSGESRQKKRVRQPGQSHNSSESPSNRQDALGVEDVSKVEVTTKKRKEKKNPSDHETHDMEDVSKQINNEQREVDQNALGAEGASKVEFKTKKSKKKNYLDHKTYDMGEKDDVSLIRKDEEPEFDRKKLAASSSSSVLIQNNMAQGASSSETSEPRCSCESRTRKLVVFDLNGILGDIQFGPTGPYYPDGTVWERSGGTVRERSGKESTMWSLDQNKCKTTKFKTLENKKKPLFLKNLRTVWDSFGTCSSCGKRKYDETNTLLVDDSPNKALCNPPYTGIFPYSYKYLDDEDSALGPEGELRKYLERLADAENVQKFVAENPFGQTAITETHESWEFYSKVIEAYK